MIRTATSGPIGVRNTPFPQQAGSRSRLAARLLILVLLVVAAVMTEPARVAHADAAGETCHTNDGNGHTVCVKGVAEGLQVSWSHFDEMGRDFKGERPNIDFIFIELIDGRHVEQDRMDHQWSWRGTALTTLYRLPAGTYHGTATVLCGACFGDHPFMNFDATVGPDQELASVPCSSSFQTGGGSDLNGTDDPRPYLMSSMVAVDGPCPGYWIATQFGQVRAVGGAQYFGDVQDDDRTRVDSNGNQLVQPSRIVALARSSLFSTNGYFLADAEGRVYAYGDAKLFGSAVGTRLAQPIVAMAVTPFGDGYWLTGADGSVFPYGAAQSFGSTSDLKLNQPVTGMITAPDGKGYWLVASDGGIFAFGSAKFYGSTGNIRLNKPIVGMTAGAGGSGYRFVASDGGIFSFGAPFHGSLGSQIGLPAPIVAMAPSAAGEGYYLLNSVGDVYAFGDAPYVFGARNYSYGYIHTVAGL